MAHLPPCKQCSTARTTTLALRLWESTDAASFSSAGTKNSLYLNLPLLGWSGPIAKWVDAWSKVRVDLPHWSESLLSYVEQSEERPKLAASALPLPFSSSATLTPLSIDCVETILVSFLDSVEALDPFGLIEKVTGLGLTAKGALTRWGFALGSSPASHKETSSTHKI